MEAVLDCVISYIHDGSDRKAVSLVSRRFYQLEGVTRKHLTVYLHYARLSPFRVNQLFPNLESLTLKEFHANHDTEVDVTPWIREIAVSFKCLKALHFRYLKINESDLELLAKTRGNDLTSLKIYGCVGGFSENGLMHISMYCHKLTVLCLTLSYVNVHKRDWKWLSELALRNSGIETLSLKLLYNDLAFDEYLSPYYQDIAPLLQTFSKSLVSLTIGEYYMDPTGDTMETLWVDKRPSCRHTGRKLSGYFCKNLRRLTFPSGTHTGLIAVAKWCPNLEFLHVILADISNEALECVGSNLKKLRDFDLEVGKKTNYSRNDLLLDNGIRAMLIGCTRLERLGIHLYTTAYLTDMGLWFIGIYGVTLRFLSLTRVGESDAGLVELSKGCPNLRKLRMVGCPFSKQAVTGFVFNIHSLRYTWGQITHKRDHPPEYFSAVRPNSMASTIPSEVPYIILAERLSEIAIRLVGGRGAVRSVKLTLAYAREPNDLDTQLLRTMVAKSISISEERVIVDVSPGKPIESIQVQIAEVESRFLGAISESGAIKVEGILQDGVPLLTKVGDFEVVVCLTLLDYSHIILSSQVDQPGIIESIRSILKEDHRKHFLTSVGRTSIGQQAVTAFVLDWWRHNEKALKSIGKIPAVKEVVLLTFSDIVSSG